MKPRLAGISRCREDDLKLLSLLPRPPRATTIGTYQHAQIFYYFKRSKY